MEPLYAQVEWEKGTCMGMRFCVCVCVCVCVRARARVAEEEHMDPVKCYQC